MFAGMFASKPAADASKGKGSASSDSGGKIVELADDKVEGQGEAATKAATPPEKIGEGADVVDETEGSLATKASTTAA